MFNSILVVCVGNICRSPIGERLLQNVLPTKKIASAGIMALVDKPADSSARLVAEKNALSLDGHRATQLTAKMCHEYDLILVMEKMHIEMITNIAPEARGKIMLYGHWKKQEVADPYRQSIEAFEFVYSILNSSAKKWAEVLNR